MRWLILALVGAGFQEAPKQAAPYGREAFERHIAFLASDEMKGRDNDTDEGRRAAQYIADQFAAVGLKPAGKDGAWFHDFERGRNVAGMLRGTGDAREYVVVAAHHDARGVIKERVQNGADDNASGVAMVIELARSLASKPCRRDVLFVSFDAEEDGLLGSRAFVRDQVHDTTLCAAMFVFDLIGGDFVPWDTKTIYALGTEYSEELRARVVKGAEASQAELTVNRVGTYVIEMFGPRSDYGPYRAARVPYVFLTTATPWYYHTEHDDIERINFPKMGAAARFSERLVRETADEPARPGFVRRLPARDYAADARGLKEQMERCLKELDLEEQQKALLAGGIEALNPVIEKPGDDAAPRVQRAMGSLFMVISTLRPK